MKTASFKTYDGPGRISIARYAPRGTPAGYRVYKPLAPGRWFNSVSQDEYRKLFFKQLADLNPESVSVRLHELAGGHEPVLLCWEVPPFHANNWCHRRMVADWFLDKLGIQVEEVIKR